jgi:hypothetical protein
MDAYEIDFEDALAADTERIAIQGREDRIREYAPVRWDRITIEHDRDAPMEPQEDTP